MRPRSNWRTGRSAEPMGRHHRRPREKKSDGMPDRVEIVGTTRHNPMTQVFEPTLPAAEGACVRLLDAACDTPSQPLRPSQPSNLLAVVAVVDSLLFPNILQMDLSVHASRGFKGWREHSNWGFKRFGLAPGLERTKAEVLTETIVTTRRL